MVTKKRVNFLSSEEGLKTRQLLMDMVADKKFNTESGYTANTDAYPDNKLPFVDKHMNYLSVHPGVEPLSYVSNLRIMTRIR